MQLFIISCLCIAVMTAGLLGISLSVPLQAPALIFLGVAAALAAIKAWQKKGGVHIDRKERGLRFWLLVLSVVSIVFFILRAWMSPVRDLGLEDLMLILSAGTLYLVAGHTLGGKSGIGIRLGLAWVVIALLLVHTTACVFQLNGTEVFSPARHFMGAVRSSMGRVTGMYGYYGSFANFAVVAGFLSLSLGVWGRCAYPARALLLLLGLTALGLAVWSQSRSAAVSIAPAMLLFFVLITRSLREQKKVVRKSFGYACIVTAILMGLACVFAIARVFTSRASHLAGEDISPVFDSAARLAFWPMAFEQWLDYPVLGAGSRSFAYQSYLYWNPNLSGMHANPEYVHNEYLQLLADYGIVGLLFVLVLFVMHGFAGTKTLAKLSSKVGEDGFKTGSNAIALAIAGLCGMVAMATHICFDFRTHLQANLLLLVCCAIWVLPLPRVKGSGDTGGCILGRALASTLMILGLSALALGGQQLWAGLPLMENRMAKEEGQWKPQGVDRGVWIPALEKSLARAPQWQRYLRLGTLYQLEADNASAPQEMQQMLKLAEKAYLSSVARHAFDPIARINLAAIYTQQERWQEAEKMYESASDRAKSREPWFGMHTLWADMYQTLALAEHEEGHNEAARRHLKRAMELYEQSRALGLRRKFYWAQNYTRCLIAYAHFLGEQASFEEAGEILLAATQIPGGSEHLQETRLHFHRALHYYRHGQALWLERNPDGAYQMMLLAKKAMLQDKKFASQDDHLGWDRQMEQIQEIIEFFELTGVAE